MNIVQLTLVVLAVWCTSCANHKKQTEKKPLNRDSLLLTKIGLEFNERNVTQGDFANQLRELRGGPQNNRTYSNVTESKWRDFQLRAYRFVSQRYPPFIIEITDSNDQLVSFFTFADELYYLSNSLSSEFNDSLELVVSQNTEKIDSTLAVNLTLDKNLNELITNLKIEEDLNEISKLIAIIFQQLLKLDQYDDEEIETLMKEIIVTHELKSYLESEYRTFHNDESNTVFRFKANEGEGGYWKLLVVPGSAGYRVKSKFFSDALYTAIFF